MEVFIIILALGVSTAIGAVIGFYVASTWQFQVKIAKKQDYEAKLAELENLLETLTKETTEPGEQYRPYDMFPPNIEPEYGLPKSLKR